MNPEKTYLYQKECQQQAGEETLAYRKRSKTTTTSNSQRRSDHKHRYKKIILHYGSGTFVWGRQCEICGRIDSAYKASKWSGKDFEVTGAGLCGNWENICLTEIHQKYPEYTIMTLKNAEWEKWISNEVGKEKL